MSFLKYPLTEGFCVKVLGLVLRDPTFGARVIRALDPALMPTAPLCHIFEALSASGSVPGVVVLHQMLHAAHVSGKIAAEDFASCLELLKKACESSSTSREDITSVLQKVILSSSVGAALDEALRLYKNRDYTRIQEVINSGFTRARSLSVGGSGRLMSRDLDTYAREVSEGKACVERIPVGIEPLDLALQGGLGRGELGVILARRKGGKSQLLSHIAQTGVLTGRMAVYLSYELGKAEVENRIIAGLTGIPVTTLAWGGNTRAERERVAREVHLRLGRIFRETGGDFLVDGFPSRSMTVSDIGHYLKDTVESIGRPIDILIVDYADELRSLKRTDDMYSRLDEIYGELRALGAHSEASYASANSFNCAVWTASQVTRSGMEKELISMVDIDKSIEKVSRCDLALSINQTPAEMSMDLARVYVVTCRYAPGGRGEQDVFGPFGTDFAFGRMFKESDVRRLSRRETPRARTSEDFEEPAVGSRLSLSRLRSGLSLSWG